MRYIFWELTVDLSLRYPFWNLHMNFAHFDEYSVVARNSLLEKCRERLRT
jgi:hypothetical protein